VIGAANAIEVESVSKQYPTPAGAIRAVDGVSLRVERAASLAIMGPSGCGKSTLLGLIGGLEAPTSGRVFLGDREISSLSERERASLRRDELGLIFQSHNLLPFLTAEENVALRLALNGARYGYDRCLEVLAQLRLTSEADKLPDQLSGGQRQRVAVARALVHRPAIILADEPTGSLDTDNSASLIEILLATQAEVGSTLVVVTHDPKVAGRLDRVLNFRDGRLADDDLLERPQRRRIGV
jgi:putative ABC transport system ATP-binding protein